MGWYRRYGLLRVFCVPDRKGELCVCSDGSISHSELKRLKEKILRHNTAVDLVEDAVIMRADPDEQFRSLVIAHQIKFGTERDNDGKEKRT